MREKISMPQMARLSSGVAKIINDHPRTSAAKAVAFFKGNFRRKGFPMNGRIEKWKPRNKPDYRKGGALLVKDGDLRRSIHTISATPKRVVVGSNWPYAQIHNEGGTVDQNVTVRSHTRKAHKAGGKRRKEANVKSHSRHMRYKMPKRQFIGHSPDLMKSIERETLRQVRELEKDIFK